MKVWSSLLVVTALAGQVAEAFVPSTAARSVAVECNMFGGAGAGLPSEDDGNNPPQFFKITITDTGKALGKDGVSKELVKVLKESQTASNTMRANAQNEMMQWIGTEMQKISL